MKTITISLLTFLSLMAYSQKDSASIVEALTNNDSRQWQMTTTKINLGSACESGGYLIFYSKDNKMIQKDCNTTIGKWETVTKKWRIGKIKRKWYLILPGEYYQIDLANTKERTLTLTLRKMPHGREVIFTKVYQATP